MFRACSILCVHLWVRHSQLTGKGRPFLWLPEHQVEFDKLKNILSSDLIVRHFDHRRQVYLLTDASGLFGIGYALGHMERDQSGKEVFKIVNCGSKELTPRAQRLINLEIPVLVRSLKSSNVELG